MTAPQPPRNHRVARGDASPALTIDELLEENKQLRALVVQLSEIVVRNVLHQNPAGVASTADGNVGPPPMTTPARAFGRERNSRR